MKQDSTTKMWAEYVAKEPNSASVTPKIYKFGAVETEANSLANAAAKGQKKSNSHALLTLQLHQQDLPKTGDLAIVTNWEGTAACILKTAAVTVLPYFNIDPKHMALDGNPNIDFAAWKEKQWERYTKELKAFNRNPSASMIVVYETFERVF